MAASHDHSIFVDGCAAADEIAALTARLQAAEKMYENSQRTVAEMTGAYEAMESERDDAVKRLQAAEAALRDAMEMSARSGDARIHAAAERDDARRRLEAVEGAAKHLVDRLDAVHADARYAAVWHIAQMHVGPYLGPMYAAELNALRTALTEPTR